MTRWTNLALLLACLSLVAAAPPVKPSPERRSVSKQDRRRARKLFEQSEVAFQAGRLDEASELLKAAYKIDPHPVLLYNLARSEESAGRLESAKNAYQEYLAAAPDAEDRPLVEQRLAVLSRQIAQQAQLNRPSPPPSPPPPPPLVVSPPVVPSPVAVKTPALASESRSWAAPVTLLTLGLAGVGAGVGLAVVANGRQSDAEAALNHRDAVDKKAQADDFALGANIAYGVGGTVGLAGVVWLLVRATESSSDAPPLSLGYGGQGVWVAGRW